MKIPSVDVLLVGGMLLALSVGQPVFVEAGGDEVPCSAWFFAAFCASPSRHVFSLLLPFFLMKL